MDLGLAGRIAIVNGASHAIVRTLAEEGARVVATARRAPALEEAVRGIAAETGGEVVAVQGDVRRAEDCLRIVDETVGRFGGVDILVNNDGAPPLGAFTDFDDHAWSRAVDQNLMSVVRCIRAAAPHMKARGSGSVVKITGLSAIEPIPDSASRSPPVRASSDSPRPSRANSPPRSPSTPRACDSWRRSPKRR